MTDQTPITASFVLNEMEIKKVRSIFFGQSRSSKIVTIAVMAVLVIGLTYAVLSGWIWVDWESWDLRNSAIVIVTLLALYLYFRWQRRSAERTAIADDPTTNRRIELTFSPDGIVSKIEGLSETSHLWKGFLRARHSPEGLLLYQGLRVCLWVPNHAFASPADADAAAALVQQHVSDYSEERAG